MGFPMQQNFCAAAPSPFSPRAAFAPPFSLRFLRARPRGGGREKGSAGYFMLAWSGRVY